jgi:undecaprenyl-diphosphatase
MTAERDRALGWVFFLGLSAAVLALFLFAWLADEMLEGDTNAFDEYIRLTLNSHASPNLTAVMRFFTAFGSPVVVLALSAAVVAIFYYLQWRRAVCLFPITIAGAFVLNTALKLAFQRPRPPDTFFGTPLPATYSFPSGHAMLSACFFGIVAALVSPRLRSRASRVAIWIAAIILALAIGVSRIYLGVHYPSDVIAGYAASVVWIVTVASGDRLLRRRRGGR